MEISHFKKRETVDDLAWQSWLGNDDHKSHQDDFRAQSKHYVHEYGQEKSLGRKLVPGAKSVVKNGEQNKSDVQSAHQIAISLQLPQLPHFPVMILSRRVKTWLGLSILLIGLLLGGRMALTRDNTLSTGSIEPVIPQAELGYRPLVPPEKVNGETQTASSPVFDSKRKLFTFTDVFLGSNLTINQQPLPEKFIKQPGAIVDLAKSIGATENVTSIVGKAYLHTDEFSGAQRLMVVNDKMLMFIQGTKKLQPSDWVEYLQSLE